MTTPASAHRSLKTFSEILAELRKRQSLPPVRGGYLPGLTFIARPGGFPPRTLAPRMPAVPLLTLPPSQVPAVPANAPDPPLAGVLATMRNRPIEISGIVRGAGDPTLTLSDRQVAELVSLANQGQQPVTAELDLGQPVKGPSPFGGGNRVNAVHDIRFHAGDRATGNIRYIRFVKSAKVGQGGNPAALVVSGTVPGYVSYESQERPGEAAKAATETDEAYLARLTGIVNARFATAEWSYDGPKGELKEGAGQGGGRVLSIKDTPGLTSDYRQYPIVQKYEFIGVLFDDQQILNVTHYGDTLRSLNPFDAVQRF